MNLYHAVLYLQVQAHKYLNTADGLSTDPTRLHLEHLLGLAGGQRTSRRFRMLRQSICTALYCTCMCKHVTGWILQMAAP